MARFYNSHVIGANEMLNTNIVQGLNATVGHASLLSLVGPKVCIQVMNCAGPCPGTFFEIQDYGYEVRTPKVVVVSRRTFSTIPLGAEALPNELQHVVTVDEACCGLGSALLESEQY